MSNAQKYVESKWMGGKDLAEQPRRAVIFSVDETPVRGVDGKDQDKLVVTFQGVKKQLILNKVNAKSLIGLFGPETDAWVGKTVVLYPLPGEMNGEAYVGVRIKAAAAVSQTAPAPVVFEPDPDPAWEDQIAESERPF